MPSALSLVRKELWWNVQPPSFFLRWIENTDSDLKAHPLHYANELLPRVRLSFQNLLQTRSTCRNNIKKCLGNNAYSLSIRVQTTINHISILCFLPQYQRQRKCFFFRARAVKRHCATQAAWLGPGNFWLVRSEHAHASYPGLFFRLPGFSPYRRREKRIVQGLD